MDSTQRARDGGAPALPWVLRRLWRLSDPSTRCTRRCDALDRDTVQQLLRTGRGEYWVCGATGQLARERGREATDLAALYDAAWRERAAPAAPTDAHRRFVAGFRGDRHTGRLFEAGVGQGALLRAAVDAGWRAEGSDLSPVAAARAGEATGAPVHGGSLDDLELAEGAYDVVLLNHVFEHLEQPRAALRRLARALRPGGAMFLQTLNAGSLSLAVNPREWFQFGPGHLHVPTLPSLGHCFAAARLRVERLSTLGFRSGSGRGRRRIVDRLGAGLAGRLGLGHRVTCHLRRA